MKLAVIVPCFNEERTIPQVIHDFRAALGSAEIHVFDNASTDNTAEVAKAAGAVVHHVSAKGKGNVVRRMFADVDADWYIMVDGDATYDAPSAPSLLDKAIAGRCDMIVGVRHHTDVAAYRAGHQWGNRMLTGAVRLVFGGRFKDMLSGYRIFSRRFAKSFPALARGFEIETELTVHALELRIEYAEVDTPYYARPEGSVSKLSTYKDGLRISRTIARLLIQERPFQVGALLAGLMALISIGLAIPVFTEYFATGQVPRLPTALFSTGLMLAAIMVLAWSGLMEISASSRREAKRLFYLTYPGPQ